MSDPTDPHWLPGVLSDQWHCHQLAGARVVCEREDLRARIEALQAENERLRAALEHLVDLDVQGEVTDIAVCALDGTS